MSVRISKLSLPFIVAGLVPVAAFATDETLPATGAHNQDSSAAVTDEPLPEATTTTTETAPSTPTTGSTTSGAAASAPTALPVNADDDDEKIADALVTPAGVYGFLGGGATNFTQSEANGSTDAGGYWDARVGIGSRSILGAEVGYVGSARDIQALGAGSEAWLMSNGVEGIARLNVPITPEVGDEDTRVLIEPYTFGGIGWNRYNVVSDVSLSADVTNEDDVMTVPLGVGMAFGFSGVTLDTRATYRQAIGSDLLGSETSSFGDSSLNSWAAGAALGFEF